MAGDGPERARRVSTADVRLVPARRLITAPVDALFALAPGDRALVSPGDLVVVGAPIAERLRDPRLDEVDLAPSAANPLPGARWSGQARRGTDQGPTGEYVFEWHGRWRIARGDITDPLETPFAGNRPRRQAGDRHHHPCRRPGDPRDRRPRRADPRSAPARRRR